MKCGHKCKVGLNSIFIKLSQCSEQSWAGLGWAGAGDNSVGSDSWSWSEKLGHSEFWLVCSRGANTHTGGVCPIWRGGQSVSCLDKQEIIHFLLKYEYLHIFFSQMQCACYSFSEKYSAKVPSCTEARPHCTGGILGTDHQAVSCSLSAVSQYLVCLSVRISS